MDNRFTGTALVGSRQWCRQWLKRAGVRDALMRPVPVAELLTAPDRSCEKKLGR